MSLACGQGFECCKCGLADQESLASEGFATRHGPGGHSPLWLREDTVGRELCDVGFMGTMEEAGAIELILGEGEFRGGRGGRGLAFANCAALVCQHFGAVELTNAVADAVVDADHKEKPRFDEVSLHAE